MEPLVFFGAALVVYCGYITINDEVRGLRKARTSQAAEKTEAAKKAPSPALFSARGRAGGAGGRWPAPLGGSA